MRLRKLPSPFRNRLTDHVETVVILMTDRACRIEQKISLVAAKIEHAFAAPVRMIKLLVEIYELRGFDELRTQCLLLGCTAPEMNFLDDHKCVRKVSRKGAKGFAK